MANLPKIRRASSRASRHFAETQTAPPKEPDVQRLEAHGLTWLNIESPSELEIDWLAEHHDFHPLDIEDVRSRRRQRAKIDEYDDYVFIVLHFPRFDKRTQRLQAAELNVFVARDLIITIPNESLKPLSALWARCNAREDEREAHMSKGSGYLLYEIVDSMYDYCFPILDKIGHKLDEIEDALFEGRAKEMVRQISNVKQEIIAYRKIISPELATLRVLEAKTASRFLPGTLEVYYDDVIDAGQRIWDLLENYKEVSEALEGTNETVLQHGLNDTLLVLTVLNALVLPMTFITGLYGMNVKLPGQNTEHAFTMIIIVLVLVVALFLAAFRRWRRF